ncbi:MAG: M23 family metallopeptidase [Candidatus Rokubacteria bacterium]|nr:M23 family metallopeptidase [Candidatus Rokubacteria bacterium]
MARRTLWLTLLATVLVLVGASSPWIAQRAPRFLFPALAAVGAVLVVWSFVNALVRLVRRYRGDGRLRLYPVVVSVVAMVFLVILPARHLLRAMTAPPDGAPRILAGFGDWLGSEGYPRPSPHRGIDVAGRPGADVLAAADGRVTVARDTGDLCGLIVVIAHEAHGYRTVYCHFSAIAVSAGDSVRRGQRIGAVGTSGQRAWPGFEHVHLELQRGRDRKDIEDPLPRIVGCFAETRRYPPDRLVLTYPVKC